jgi:ribosomal protein L11 methyltransferase
MLTEVKVEIAPESADSTDNVLLELGNGCWSVLEDSIAKRAWIVGIFEDEAKASAGWVGLQGLLPEPPAGGPAFKALARKDWAESYKEHFHAWRFGRLHWVPSWERPLYKAPSGDAVLWLDPGLAFGTGNHETTRLCVERLVALAEDAGAGKSEAAVIDAGSGSGILALSAVLLGFGSVLGFDNDPEAVRVSRENADLNGLGDRVVFSVADISEGLAGRRAGVVLANIQADVLAAFRRELTGAVAPGGRLVLSGILAGERDAVLEAFQGTVPGWEFESRTLGEWADILLTRPAPS